MLGAFGGRARRPLHAIAVGAPPTAGQQAGQGFALTLSGGATRRRGLALIGGQPALPHNGALFGRGALRARPLAGMARGLPTDLVGLGAGTVITLVALVWYLIGVANLAVNYQQADLIVQGGWIGVRLLGTGTAVFAALLVNRARDDWAARRKGDDRATVVWGWPAHLTVWTTLIGSALLLVWLTYWGVFQLGI